MLGSPVELKWNRKDLQSLVSVLAYVKTFGSVVQAGGCLGVFAKELAKHFKAVYTFEPSPELFAKLCVNVPEPNVVKLQAALGYDRWLVQTVCQLRGDDGKTVLHEGMTRTEPMGAIPTLRVDDLGLLECGLIYLDVEGDELFALRGAEATIDKCRPVVVCEINRGIRYRGLSEDDIVKFMTARGYREFVRHRSDVVFLPKDWMTK